MTKDDIIQELKNYCKQEIEKAAEQLSNIHIKHSMYNYFITWKKAHIEILEKIGIFENK